MNFLIQLVVMIVAALITAALQPKPPVPKPLSITDFDIPTAEEGRPIPVVFGEVLVKGSNVVWYGNLTTSPIKSSGGGKK
jgi:hypothetical protein